MNYDGAGGLDIGGGNVTLDPKVTAGRAALLVFKPRNNAQVVRIGLI